MNNSRYNEKNWFLFRGNEAIVTIIRLIIITITRMIFYHGKGVGIGKLHYGEYLVRYDSYRRHKFQTNNYTYVWNKLVGQ